MGSLHLLRIDMITRLRSNKCIMLNGCLVNPHPIPLTVKSVRCPVDSLDLADGVTHYNSYGSCPLTVERGKIVLAEFGYGGKLLPSFPSWVINGKQPSRLAWILKEKLLPPVYWQAMLKGNEWMVEPKQAAPSRESV